LNQSAPGALLQLQSPGGEAGIRLPITAVSEVPTSSDRGIPNESARVTTTINIANPLFNTRDESRRIQAVLRHLGTGADLRDFSGSASEKVALVKTANQRGLIAWHKARGRYELTPAGWCELAPSRRFGVGAMMLGTTFGATLGAVALAAFWFTGGIAAHRPAAPRSVVAAAPAQVAKPQAQVATPPAHVVKPSAPATTAAASSPAPAPPTTAATAPSAAAPTVPAAAPVEPDPTTVAHEPAPEQRADADATAKQAADAKKQAAAAKKEKARQRAAARRKREEAARAWAGTEPRDRQAEYSGYGGGYGYGGGRNSWFAYR
jgi:hypothetical protein